MYMCMFFVFSFLSALVLYFVFFFKQKTAYEMLISDWSSDVCSSDLTLSASRRLSGEEARRPPAPRPDGRAARWWCNSALEGSMILLVTPDRVRGDGTGKSSPILQTTSPQGTAFA